MLFSTYLPWQYTLNDRYSSSLSLSIFVPFWGHLGDHLEEEQNTYSYGSVSSDLNNPYIGTIIYLFLTNSIEVPQDNLDRWIMPVSMFFSMNSCSVCNSKTNRKYIEPRKNVLPFFNYINRLYGLCSESSLVFCLLKISVNY